ncbi:molecular chaperone HscC [Tissierella praeacuta]|uniref:Hsp70 family protein n=1 Tax=Tissierella praeacuta TaxID=43131 RepID=UPI00334001A1
MIIGIDLGTTNSSVSYFTENGPRIIPNRLGKNITPSVVSIDEDSNIYVGETALERSAIYYDNTAQVFKRDMGSQKVFKLGNDEFKAEELSSFILRYLKEDAEHFLGEKIEEAVISVPAYFNDEQRKATKKAGEMAGFKVERIISEPTAAAIAYGLYQKRADAKILVFDLGGGTFDVSILELFNNILEVRAVAGDNYLGGEDFTQILVDLFIKKNNIDINSLDLKILSHILDQAEKCKRGFSDSKISSMNCIINGEQIEFQINMEDYEEACEPLLEKMRNPIKRSLSDTNLRLSQIDDVILVGGSTKLPIVRKFVNKLFGRFPNTSINPDEAVSLGSAVQAAMKERNQYIKEVILTDVCPYTLGTEVVMERENNRIESGYFCPIIDRNTVIPASRTQTLYTVYDNQSKIRINILQGESRFAKNNISLGELFVEVPLALAGQESIDVTYTYDINSILEVEVKVNSTGNKVKQIIKNKNNDMTDEMIEKRMEEISYLKIPPREQEKNKLLLFRSERMYEESIGDIRNQLDYAISKFESALKTQDPVKIETAREVFKEELDYIEEEQKLR